MHLLRSKFCIWSICLLSLHVTLAQEEGTSKHPSADSNQNPGILLADEIPLAQIDSYIEEQRIKHSIPAVSLALIKNGEILYFKNYGVINNQSKVAVDSLSIFEAASITKPVFSYLVCRKAQMGEIDLDTPLHDRFPFSGIDDYPEYTLMTPRHVLTHTSGLGNWGIELLHTPGTQYGYSGQGFEYLTKALAKSYTRQMDRYMAKALKEEVLEPFNMNHTYFMKNSKMKRFSVDGHKNDTPTEHWFPDYHEMAGGMFSNAKDIARFAIAMLERKGLTPQMAQQMFSIQTKVEGSDKEFNSDYDQGYGLGMYLRQSPYGLVFGHSGSNGDFECMFEVYDELKMGYVIMTNSDTGENLTEAMANYLVEGQ